MKLYIETLGCPKNANDSEIAAGICERSGHTIVSFPEEADVIIVNTCGFINDAKRESIDTIFSMAEYRQYGARLIVTGCLSQRYPDELLDEIPEIDALLGVNDYPELPEILDRFSAGTKNRFRVCHPYRGSDAPEEFRKFPDPPYTSYLKIAEGCNNICAYCVIPQIRGPYRSRSMESILKEAETLSERGCRELVLIAQDVTYYGMDLYHKLALPELLRKLCRIDGIRWIRLMYCYEDRITDELIDVIAEEEKICNYLDIPIQHASDPVLKAMNRRSTGESLRNTLRKLSRRIPDIHIRTTLIVGFPGETEEDYDQLIDFVESQRFARLGVFAYSQEEGTPAGEMPDQIPEEVKSARLDGIMMRQLEISLSLNQEKVGSIMEVIVDEQDEDGAYIGRTRYDAPEIDNAVIFASVAEHRPGDIVQVEITDAFDYDLEGREVFL